ncbi:MAG: histidinol dehydrogenase [Saprospiraceae bacterium]|jgi:histidinol dehydrogenase|nr:histidinol dehydrogenase [Saprospiraceae bacterium]MBL0025366.1 histidinol dehydrogenase [Saprospiraceae bacterium]
MLEKILNPNKSDFVKLSQRPVLDNSTLMTGVQTIFNEIKRNRDAAVLNYTEKLDGIKLSSSVYDITGVNADSIEIEESLKNAIKLAYKNIYAFHCAQKSSGIDVETMPGIMCSQRSIPLTRIGLYIPGGSAPLFSTVLMLAVPALIAGCKEIILCTPPDGSGSIHPAILYSSLLCGISAIRLAGGAQAIAAMTIGTKDIPAVDKIFGPGNQYVTAAKQLAQNYNVAIDMPAGPSEVLVYADATCIPEFVAADLLAQAEHGSDSQVILVANSVWILDKVNDHLTIQISNLPRKAIATQALSHSKAIFIEDVETAFDFINEYAPEHLIIASDKAESYINLIKNAGSVFLGNYCPESAGDYASGTNHTLPTNGWAKKYSGVNLDSYMKKVTFQSITRTGLNNLGATLITMAEAEHLQGHANAVSVRLNY